MQRSTTTVDLLAPWTQAQQAFWERWRAAMANDAKPALPTMGMWNLPIEFWKAAIYEGLEVQLAAAEAWKSWVCANDANIPELTLGACQTLHFAEDWTRAQMQLWEGWFAALESLAPPSVNQPAEGGKPARRERARATHAPVGQPVGNGVPA